MSVNNTNVIYNYAAFIIASFFALLINVIVVKFYDESVLGYLNFFLAIVILTSQVAVGGVQFSVLKHAALFVNRESELSFLLSSSILLIISYCFVLGAFSYLLFIFFDVFSFNVSLFWYCTFFLTVLFFSINKVFLSFVNGVAKLKLVALFNGSRFIIFFVVVLLFYYYGLGSEFIVLTVLFSEILLFIFYLLLVVRFYFGFRFFCMRWLKRHAGFGLRGFIGGALMEINTRVDVIMLTAMLGYSSVGIYSFASMIAEGFVQTFTVLKNNVDPIFSKCCKEGSTDKIELVIINIRTKYIGLLCFLGAVGCLFFPVVFLYLFNIESGFVFKAWCILIIYVGFVILSANYRPFIGLSIQANKPQFFSLVVLISVFLNLILNYVLIQIIGLNGAAVATGIAFFFESFLLYKYSQTVLNIKI